MKTTTQTSATMKRSSKFAMLAAAISLALVLSESDDNRVDISVATSTPETSLVAESKHLTRRTTMSVSQAVDTSHAPQEDAFSTTPTMQQETAMASTVFAGPPVMTAKSSQQSDGGQSGNSIAPRDKMSGPVAALLDSGASGDAELVVRYGQYPQLFDDDFVAELGGEVTRVYEHLDMRAVRVPVAALEHLAADENVAWLSLDDDISATSVSSRVAANLPTSASANGVYAGTNIGIAVLDTGVSLHADLSDSIVQYSFLNGAYPVPTIVNGEVVVPSIAARVDGFGHGTHVAGLLAGSGVDSNDQYKGSSTGAKILSLQVLDANGQGSMSDVMAALDWLQTYGAYFDVRIVNLSLGKGISESNTTDPLVAAVENLWDAGMVVVVAAGNEGFSGSMTVTSPGNSRKVITVGSLTDNSTGQDYSDDYVSSFSSQGPTVGDYVLKPDLLAPGNRVVSAADATSKLGTLLSSRLKACLNVGCAPETVYLELSGTSMATPIVSSAIALMLEKDPTLTPATVKARLMRSARKVDADPTEAGAGLLDVDAALNDSGIVAGEALSPLMLFDNTSAMVLIEDTALLWGDDLWGAAYLFNGGLAWSSGASYTDANGVTANGYMWTDGGVSANGYMWTDGGVSAKGYMWTDGPEAKSLLDGSEDTQFFLNDDAPSQ